MNLILFGPPGVGKSTLIAILKTRGMRAIDLEDVYPSVTRFNMPAWLDHVILGGADLNPARKYTKAKKVLLIARQSIYDSRREIRDAAISGKGAQKKHLVGDWLRGASYDYIIDTSTLTPSNTADIIQAIFRKED